MASELSILYATWPDEKLQEVLLNPHEYRREAIWTAEVELAGRGIPVDALTEMKDQGAESAIVKREKAEQPLSFSWKIGYFLGAIMLFSPFVWVFYRRHAEQGYDRRSFESMAYAFLGLLFYAAVVSVLVRLHVF